jgi:hypothetical protein
MVDPNTRKSRESPGESQSTDASSRAAAKRRQAEHSGHLDPAHAARLLRLSRETDQRDVDVAFVAEPRSRDALAEQFGEETVSAMTSGESSREEDRDEDSIEELGGPFVETSASEEFAEGTDDTNIPGATREPFPKTSGG